MKSISPLLLITLLSLNANAQEQRLTGRDRVFYRAPAMTPFYTYDFIDSATVDLKYNYNELDFVLLNTYPLKKSGSVNSYIEVQFFDITNDANEPALSLRANSFPLLKGSAEYINSDDNNKRFVIEISLLDKLLHNGDIQKCANTGIYSIKFVTGASISTPFKFRPKLGEKNYTISSAFTLGPYAGISMRLDRLNPVFLNLVVSGGVSSVSITDNEQIAKDGKDGLEMGLFGAAGLILQVDKFQIGGMIGGDFVSGERGRNWIYNDHPWISFSLGYNFIGSTTKDEKKANIENAELKESINLATIESLKGIGRGLNTDGASVKDELSPTIAIEVISKQPTIGASGKDTASIAAQLVKAANYLQEKVLPKNETKWWVYIGQFADDPITGQKILVDGHFNQTSLPVAGNYITAKDAVYKRARLPIQLQNGEWKLGDIQGVVEGKQTVKLLEVKQTSDGNVWAKVTEP